MEFFEAVRARRSVRRFKPDPVPEESLGRVLEAFRAAPSWANTQPWELVLVSDPETKARLRDTLSQGNPARDAMTQAPLLACVVGIPGRSGWYHGKAATSRGEMMLFDLGIAAEHLALAAAAEGLGTVHVALFDIEKAGSALGLPAGRSVVEMLPMGFPAGETRRVERKALKDFVFRDRYGEKRFPD
jgi:nitroreductase